MSLDDTKVAADRQAALDYHEFPKPGKLEIRATKPMATGRDLSLAYSPGVADACLEIEKKPEGIYVVLNVTAEPAVVKELDRQYFLNEQIMRTKVLRPDLHL